MCKAYDNRCIVDDLPQCFEDFLLGVPGKNTAIHIGAGTLWQGVRRVATRYRGRHASGAQDRVVAGVGSDSIERICRRWS